MSTTSVKFRSTTPNLNVLIRSTPKGVAFKDHVFVTSDAAVAAELRQHASCGSEFTEETSAVQAEIAKVAADNPASTAPGTGDDSDKPKDGGEGKEKKPPSGGGGGKGK